MPESPLPKAPDLITIKRGTQPALAASNYVPASGEIIGRINTYGYIDKLKVGDGTHKYDALPFIGEQENVKEQGIRQYLSIANFPLLGSDQVLYLDLNTRTLYYWDITTNTYKEPKDLVGVPEAPATGKKYARQGNAWAAVREVNVKGNIYTSIQNTEEYTFDYDTTALATVLTFKTLTSKTILDCQVSLYGTGTTPATVEFREKNFKMYGFELENGKMQKYQLPITSDTVLNVLGKVKVVISLRVQDVIVTEVEEV